MNAMYTNIHKLNPWISRWFIASHYKSFRREGYGVFDAIKFTDTVFSDAYKTYKSILRVTYKDGSP